MGKSSTRRVQKQRPFTTDLGDSPWLRRAGHWIVIHVSQGRGHSRVITWVQLAVKGQRGERNHKARPNMGDGNSGSSFDFEGPQNTLGAHDVSLDPKTSEEDSRVSVSPQTQAIPSSSEPPGRPMTW